MRRLFAVACVLVGACGGSHADVGTDASTDAAADVAVDVALDAAPEASGDLVSIATSPPFAPAFSLSTFDYALRCKGAQNAVTVTVTTTAGSSSTIENLVPNEDFVALGAYHIRCLPPDFPALTVTLHADNGAPTPGWYLVNSTYYAIVLDTHGTPVWYKRSSGFTIDVDSLAQNQISFQANAELPQAYDTKPSFGVLDLGTLATTAIKSPDAPTDEHELQRLANGDYLVITNPVVLDVDLTGLGTFGAQESVVDSQIEELDANNQVVWSWSAFDHIDPLTECTEPDTIVTGSSTHLADVFHCNSIDVDAAGNLVLSMRNDSAVYYVDKASGDIVWKLGGTPANEDDPELVAVTGDPQTTFRLQHDARISNGDITMFDDGSATSARAAVYTLDHVAHTATLAWQYAGTGPSGSQGSFRRQLDGHAVIGWGNASTPRLLTELDAAGHDVLDIDFVAPAISYRAIKVPLSQLDLALMRASAGK
jgi:hypothetical protein